MKKITTLLLSISLAISISACGSTEPTSTNNVAVEAETQVVDATATEIIESAEVEIEVHTEVAVETEVTEIATEVQEELVIVVKELNQIMYANRSVNVRSGDSTDYEKVGALSLNQEVHVTGQSEVTGWYRISWNGDDAFVSNNYLSTEKTVVQSNVSEDDFVTPETGSDSDARPGEITVDLEANDAMAGDGGEYIGDGVNWNN